MPSMHFPMPLLFITAVKDICAINTFEKLLNILFSEVYCWYFGFTTLLFSATITDMSLYELLNLFPRWPLVFRSFLHPLLVARDVVTLYRARWKRHHKKTTEQIPLNLEPRVTLAPCQRCGCEIMVGMSCMDNYYILNTYYALYLTNNILHTHTGLYTALQGYTWLNAAIQSYAQLYWVIHS